MDYDDYSEGYKRYKGKPISDEGYYAATDGEELGGNKHGHRDK